MKKYRSDMVDNYFTWKGFTWRNGRHWGAFHPEHICYCSLEDVYLTNDILLLDVSKRPVMHDGKEYQYSVGYVSTIETVKYGTLEVKYMLPQGLNLWPAIWMTDGKTWPPEIDIVEAWSDCGDTLSKLFCGKHYLRHPFVNYIFPGIFMGTTGDTARCESSNKFGGTCSSYVKESSINTCRLEWREDFIKVWYNGHQVMNVTDKDKLVDFNNSEGLEIHLNNYVQNVKTDDCDGITTAFAITDLRYEK